MIRLGKHLSAQSRHDLVKTVVTSLLRDKSVRGLSRKLNIAEDTIYAIKRGLLFGTAGYARQVYKGEKLANYVFKDLRGVKGKAKRTLQEAYLLVGGSPLIAEASDLNTMNTLSIKAYEDRKNRAGSKTDKDLLRKLTEINSKGKNKKRPAPSVMKEIVEEVEINEEVTDEIVSKVTEKKEVQLNELTFSVNGAHVVIKSSGGTLIINF